MVFGTPTIGMPFFRNRVAIRNAPSPPIAISASPPTSVNRRMMSSEMSIVTFLPSRSVMNSNGWPLLTVPRMVPPRWAMPRTLSRVRSTRPLGPLEQAVVAAADAGDLPATAQAGERDGANDCVQAGRVTPAGVDQDVHTITPYRGCTRSARDACEPGL